jgi:hypothetical protein
VHAPHRFCIVRVSGYAPHGRRAAGISSVRQQFFRIWLAISMLAAAVAVAWVVPVSMGMPFTCTCPVPFATTASMPQEEPGYILDFKTPHWSRLKARVMAYRYDLHLTSVGHGAAMISHISDTQLDQVRCSALLASISHVIPIRVELLQMPPNKQLQRTVNDKVLTSTAPRPAAELGR